MHRGTVDAGDGIGRRAARKILRHHGALDDPWSDEFVASQARHERLRSPLAERRVDPQSFAAWATPVQRRHVGLHAGFVDEEQSCWLATHEGLATVSPFTPRRLHIGAFFLRRQQHFFYM